MDELSMLEMSMLLAGVAPGSPGADSLRQDLDRLPYLPPVYEEVARAMLEGLALAYWHQEMATRFLTEDQVSILRDAQAQGIGLDAETEERLPPVLARLDQPHVLKAAAILTETGLLVDGIVAGHQTLDGRTKIADLLADSLGAGPAALGEVPRLGPATPVEVAAGVQALAPLGAAEHDALVDQLAGAPETGLGAVQLVLDALSPIAAGGRENADLVRLGQAIDTARPTLEVWGAAADARLAWRAEQTPAPRLPDPDAAHPPLRLALPDLGVQPAVRPVPSLPEAAAAIAGALGGDAGIAADEAEDVAGWLTPDQGDVVARVLDSAARYIEAEKRVLATPVPEGLTTDAMARWAEGLDAGDLPSPASPDGQLLVSSQDHLQALAGAAKTLEELLAAAEEIPGVFAPQQSFTQSAMGPEDCPEGVPEKLTVLGYLALDLCGHDSEWTEAEAAMLVIDVGGDDHYLGRQATAPFRAQVGPNANNPDHFAVSPVSLLFDLGGNDTYDAQGRSCAQAAACPDLDVGPVADTSGMELRQSPVAILVDWEGDDADATNRFIAADQAQAYAAPDSREVPAFVSAANNQVDDPDQTLRRGVAVLVERIGSGGSLDSTYEAKARSQSSTLPGPVASGLDQSTTPMRHGSAALVRLVGTGSDATASFTAGDSSQAAAGAGQEIGLRFGTAGVALLINAAGRDAASNDTYIAGEESQASSQDHRDLLRRFERPLAFFADVAGPGSRSDDTYLAGERSRGYGGPPVGNLQQPVDPMAIFFDGLVDATLLDGGVSGLQASVEPSTSEGSSNDQYNALQAGHGFSFGFFADVGGLDIYSPSDPDDPHQGGEVGPSMDLPDPSAEPDPGEVQTGLEDGPVPRNDAVWQQEQTDALTGVDAATLGDRDRDMVPDLVESRWQAFGGLWGADPDDPDVSPLPVTPRVLLDLEGADLYLDAPHGLLLTVGGQNHYGPGYRAAVHLDLGGDDLHEGLAGATNSTSHSGNPLLSFHLDVGGDDEYLSDLPFNQGFGDTGAGLLFDLGGDDAFVAPHSAQGVGVAGGLGVLVALPGLPPASDRNVFLVDGPPAHGTGLDGGVGVFVAAGEHNAAPNGTGPGNGTALRVNPSGNQAPEVIDWAFPEAVSAGVPAELSFSAVDPDGDPLRLCFSVQANVSLSCTGWLEPDPDNGEVTYHAPVVWDQVPVNGTMGQVTLDAPIILEARDPGGLTHLVQAGNVIVHNDPPRLGEVRGDREPVVGRPTPFQVPFEPADDLLDPVILFGLPGDQRKWNATSVDWAALSSGGRAGLPLSIGSTLGGVQTESGEPDHLLDGDPTTRLALHYTSQTPHDPMQVVVDFAGPRQVRQLEVGAHRPEGSSQVQFELSMLRPGGALERVGVLQVTSNDRDHPDSLVVDLPDHPDARGLLLRQVLPHGFDPRPELDEEEEPPILNYHVEFHHIRALGPGAVGEWPLPGPREVVYQVLDRFGGFNATTFNLDVQPDPDASEDPGLPPFVAAATIASRGQVRHASLAAGPSAEDVQEFMYPITIEIQGLETDPETGQSTYGTLSVPSGQTAEVCVDWGDGSSTCKDVSAGPLRLTERRGWLEPGSYSITATVDNSNKVPEGHIFHAADIHVEPAFDLRNEDEPVLWLALDPLGRHTWYSGTPYLGTVDVAGDDRYAGTIAGPGSAGGPSLVLDLAGDDDYLSPAPRTQGFGDFGTAAVLMDLGGDDLYVAPGHAQGAAIRLGVGVLVDIAGDDRYNPVPSTHPDIAAGLPDTADAWLDRPDSLSPDRAPLAGGAPDLVQGAAIDAVGLHITGGGTDMFHAGSRAQGYGAHEHLEPMEYTPRTEDCPSVEDHVDSTIAWITYLADLGDEADPPYPWCLAGLDRGRAGSTGEGFDPLQDLEQGSPCTDEIGGGAPAPCIPGPSALLEFVADGPRFGPSLGLHLRLDGAATYHGSEELQGAAQGSGRGILVDRDGAGLLLASGRAQAHSENAIAALVLGGPAALRLGERGQSHAVGNAETGGPEGVKAPLALWIGPDQDAKCGGAPCGSRTDALALPGPEIVLTAPTRQLTGGAWKTTLRNEDLQDVTYVVFATTTMRGGPQSCLAEPIAPPIRVASGVLAADEVAALTLDLDQVLDDGPLYPAGCLQLFAYARAATATGGWSMEMVKADLARPPRLEVSGVPDLVAGHQAFLFTSDEPLAARTPIQVQYAFTADGPPEEDFVPSPVSEWAPMPGDAGATAEAVWQFPGDVSGEHTLWARTHWPAGGPVGPWQDLAQTEVFPFDNNVDLSDIAGASAQPGGLYVPAGQTLRAEGSATSPAGVHGVELRLRDDQGEPVELVRDGAGHGTLSATVTEPGARATTWKMDVRPEAQASGTLHVQGRVGWLAGGTTEWADWQHLASIQVDTEAPRVADVSSGLGAATNRDSFPVEIAMDLEDPLQGPSKCATLCPGAGIDVEALSVRLRAPDHVVPLDLVAVEEGPDGLQTHWEWGGDGIPDEGEYFIEVFARDRVDNRLAAYPGARFVVDRQPPEFQETSVGLPAGQQALKPGDEVVMTAVVLDEGEAGVHQVIATVGGAADPLLPEQGGVYTGTATVPGGGGDTISIEVEALDAAGNVATWSQEFPFHPAPPTVVAGPDVSVRAQSAAVDLKTDREVTVDGRLQAGDTEVVGAGTGGPKEHALLFSDLEPDTEYTLSLEVVDAAGWVVTLEETITTLPLLESTLDGLVAPTGTRSGPLEIHAVADCPAAVPATVALIVDGEGTGPAVEQELDPCDGEVPFTLVFDSTTVPDGAVDLFLTLDDGSRVLTEPFTVHVDNTRPQLQIALEGPATRNGWHNRTVTAQVSANDATGPVSISHQVGSEASRPGGQVALSSNGQHPIIFTGEDSAVPPNVAFLHTTILVDRTPPGIEAVVSLEPAATRGDGVPIDIEAQDGDSGVEAYRTRIAGGPWSPWASDDPEDVEFSADTPEGAHWIDIEVRDRAGNVAKASLDVLLDQTPPEVLGMRWAGTTEDGEPVLHLVAVDRLGEAGKPVGVDSVRFASPDDPDDWSAWLVTDGIGTFAVPVERTNGTHTLVQFRDRVGNVADPVASPAIPAPGDLVTEAPTEGVEEVASETEVVRDPDVQPREGRSSEPFVFSAIILGDPTAVWVEVNGEHHPATPDGPPLAEGGRLYTATITLSPTALDTPYKYRFVAESHDSVTSTALLAGPTVLAVGLAGHESPAPSGDDRGIPLSLGTAMVALGAAIMLHRRKQE